MSGFLVSPETKALLEQLIDERFNSIDERRSPRGRRQVNRSNMTIVQAQCTEAIGLATDLTTPGTGKARLLKRVSSTSDAIEAYDTDRIVDVYNYSDADSWAVDDYMIVMLLDGEWHPITSNGTGGGSSAGCRCTHLEIAEFEHPHLLPEGNECASMWQVASIEEISGPTSDGNGSVHLPATEDVPIQWVEEESSIYADVTDLLIVYNNSGTDVTSSSTPDGYLEMRFDVFPPYIHLHIDATIP